MALKKCLYCNALIYELVTSCPKCHVEMPFDEEKSAERHMEKEMEEKVSKKLREFIKCQECGHPIHVSSILLKSKSEKECSNCGFQDNNIKCFFCNSKAIDYDPYQENFTCFLHLTTKCNDCGKLTLGTEKIYYVCDSCYKKHRLSVIYKEFFGSFIAVPMFVGFLCWIVFGFGGCLIRLSRPVLTESVFKAYISEGFFGFALGAGVAILFGIYLIKKELNEMRISKI